MAKKSYLFKDILKEPGWLSYLDVARLRKLSDEVPEQEFQEFFSCSREAAKRIIFFWEIAQVELWNADILSHFFHPWIYQDRDLVALKIQSAQIAGRLPDRFTADVGLEWLASEYVPIGNKWDWVRANVRFRPPVGATSAKDEWTGERLSAERAVLTAKGIKTTTKALSEMSGLNDREVRRRIELHASKTSSVKSSGRALQVNVWGISGGQVRKKSPA